ncbi:MAG: hypothetical protein CVV44_00920 [Spirochaetae bacterium HGW-Spirochaetae-1]|jgi:two-component system phosphate regulon sensor histidine kinase PhoR|nr:MAG: hypothetical protein CVV44_00920 [Spirochaetae bacterium HGW-Spirochaetae-1]
MKKKIGNRIIVSFSLLIGILIFFLLLFFNDLVRETHMSIIKQEAEEKIRFIELVLKDKNRDRGYAAVPDIDFLRKVSGIIGLRITIVDFNGSVLADSDINNVSSMDNHQYRIEVKEAMASGTGSSIRYSNTLKIDMFYYAHKSDKYIIRLAKPLYIVEEKIQKIRKFIVFSGIFIIFTSIIIIIYISKRITNPINETMNFARDFSHGDYTRRIMNYSDDEIGNLQKSLNRLADTIVGKIDSLIFEQNKLKITLENISDGIAVIGDDKRILISNKAFNALFDINNDVSEKLYFEVIRSRTLNIKIEYVLARGQSASFEEKLISGKVCEVSINPIMEHDTLQGILVVLRDVTEKKKIEQMKTDLVGNMSHELKTPIAIMRGYLETIDEHYNDEKMCRDLIGKAIDSAERQNSIINDILKLNLLETSHEFIDEEINLGGIINNCIHLLQPKASKKNITIEKSTDILDTVIRSNRFLAEEIFFNLIDNAINYNRESGKISIHAREEKGKILIYIEDTGIGIPEESIPRVFERFYRVDKSRSRATGGTGLGLSIVKHAAEILGWDMSVASSKKGSIFTIEI